MPRAYEKSESRSRSDGSYEITIGVEGTIDDQEAEGLAAAKAPIEHRGLPRNPIPNFQCTGRGLFDFTYLYKIESEDENESDREPQGELPTIGTFTSEPAGGTQHITQCLYQTGHAAGVNTEKIERIRVIGLHKDGVHGCDIEAPGEVITLEKLWLPQAITGEYFEALKALRGKKNIAPYTMRWGLRGTRYEMTFEPDELLFLGAVKKTRITPKHITCWSISYKWLERNNRRNVRFSQDPDSENAFIEVPYIGGHDYPWAYYDKKEITGGIPATIEVPKAVFVSRVYEQANYVEHLGF